MRGGGRRPPMLRATPSAGLVRRSEKKGSREAVGTPSRLSTTTDGQDCRRRSSYRDPAGRDRWAQALRLATPLHDGAALKTGVQTGPGFDVLTIMPAAKPGAVRRWPRPRGLRKGWSQTQPPRQRDECE